MNDQISKIAVIGLGYVGLPLAIEFSKARDVIGFDISSLRIDELNRGQDSTREVSAESITGSTRLTFSSDLADLHGCDVFIITVPTPVKTNNSPDLEPLRSASRLVGGVIGEGAVVIYESTVYPGATEEVCVPILEQESGLNFNSDFFVGYSPERINPGDKSHRLPDIVKITSGSTPQVAKLVDALYSSIIPAGTHLTTSIRVAEAAKVIENAQRDINIALMNELAMIFHKLDIDTEEILQAAGSKWNFLPFRPGLVGGHCIGVDPYYLTFKAQSVGHNPEIILGGRRINDSMSKYVADRLIKAMLRKKIEVLGAKILIMGFSFKENCPDIRNTKVVEIYHQLHDFGLDVDIYDPWVNEDEVQQVYDVRVVSEPARKKYSAVVLAVAHDVFRTVSIDQISESCLRNHIIFDVKYVLPESCNVERL